jgi:uncharacterized protein involved in cysteine biosynthesis
MLGLILTGLFLAYDGFDFPLARRGLGFWAKFGYLFTHPAQSVGYAASVALLFFVPLAFIVVPPFAAVGATLAYLDSVQRKTGAVAARSPDDEELRSARNRDL